MLWKRIFLSHKNRNLVELPTIICYDKMVYIDKKLSNISLIRGFLM